MIKNNNNKNVSENLTLEQMACFKNAWRDFMNFDAEKERERERERESSISR